MSQQRPRIVAIAGPSGAGKTTLVQRVAALLDGATQVHFDDYAATSTYVSDMATWIATGADPDAWRTPRLAQDVQALRGGAAVLHPNGTDRLVATPYIVLEEPFGRQRQEMAPLVDVVVCVDLPLEIALARRIGRDIQRMRTETATSEAIVAHIEEYLRLASTAALCAALTLIGRCLAAGSRLNRRKKKPNTYQLLLDPSLGDLA